MDPHVRRAVLPPGSARHFPKRQDAGLTNNKLSQIVLTPNEDLPYKVVLKHEEGTSIEHGVATIREGEEFIRQNLPAEPVHPVERLRETPQH